MNKDSLHIKQIKAKTLGFSDFWQTIALNLGDSRLKINVQADSIKYFLAPESDHRDFLRTLIHQSYKRCRCYHLNARFDVNIALDILGETSYHLKSRKEDDLLDIELLEEIAWLINENYYQWIKMPRSTLTIKQHRADPNANKNAEQQGPANENKRSFIVSMSKLKIRRANKRL